MKNAYTSRLHSPASAGVLAAKLLKASCDSALESQGSLHIEVVRDSALDLGRQLEVFAGSGEDGPGMVGLMAESALRCADLANLAACVAPELPETEAPAAISATHLAAGATRALCPLVEAAAKGMDGELAEYALRDVRSASWRADLVVRQVEEAAQARD